MIGTSGIGCWSGKGAGFWTVSTIGLAAGGPGPAPDNGAVVVVVEDFFFGDAQMIGSEFDRS